MKNIHIPTMLSLALAAAGCGSEAAVPQAPQAVQTRQLNVKGAVHGGPLRYSAVVEPDTDVPLSFRIPGYVVALMQVRGEDGRMRDLAEGNGVRKGAVLVRIRSAEYQDRVRQAKAQAAAAEALATKARLDFNRATRLYGTDSMTKSDFDAAQAQHDATQSEVRAALAQTSEAELALADTSVVAPFDADVIKKSVELGSFAGPGVPVLTLAGTDLVKIVIGVPDTTVRSIKLGQPVEVTVGRVPRPHLPGAHQPDGIGRRRQDPQLRGGSRHSQSRPHAEGRDDWFAPAGDGRVESTTCGGHGPPVVHRAGRSGPLWRVRRGRLQRGAGRHAAMGRDWNRRRHGDQRRERPGPG